MFKCIDVHHEGTYEDPIEYNKFVTLEPGKFYTEMGIEYVCLQTPGKPIAENLCDVVDLWVREPLEMDIYPNYPSELIYDYNAEINPWPCGICTLYEGNIYLANGEGATTAPSKEDTDNWEFVSKAKPGQTGEVYVKPEPVPEPEPAQPTIPDGSTEETETPSESGSTGTGETSSTDTTESGSTDQTPSTGDNTDTSGATTDSNSTEETTPDTSKNDKSETVETPGETETPSTKEDTTTEEQTPSTDGGTDSSTDEVKDTSTSENTAESTTE